MSYPDRCTQCREIGHLALPSRERLFNLCTPPCIAKHHKIDPEMSQLIIFCLAPYHWWTWLASPYKEILQWIWTIASRNRNLHVHVPLKNKIVSSGSKDGCDSLISFLPPLLPIPLLPYGLTIEFKVSIWSLMKMYLSQ